VVVLKTILMKAWLLALLLAVAFLLAACGGAGSGQQGDQSGGHGQMDHGQMGHGSMGMGSKGMAKQMVMENGKYSDRAFIDAMVPHHQSAIYMSQVSREESKIPAIKELAQNIIDAQKREIEQMKQWRRQWYS
jgi:uncharacterized protein (DUF305 family)